MQTVTILESEETSTYEQERGKPMPSKLHARIQKRLIVLLSAFEPAVEVLSELSVVLGGATYIPDVCLYLADAADWSAEEVAMTVPPLLAVGILSPRQDLNDLIAKTEIYLASGVRAVWIVHPPLQMVFAFEPNRKTRALSEGVLVESASGASVNVEEIFA